ncbi:MAG: alpha/beta hydrolase [Hyphomicrobiales bacterium]|nr:alpha/beta hydrolase [Hyphomicrobiales bacterium]
MFEGLATMGTIAAACVLGIASAARAESRMAQSGAATIECLVAGSGPAVLMIPSLGRPARDFDDLSSRLVAAGYATIRPQPRGVGASRGPMDGLTLRDMAADALACAPAAAGPIVVVGHAYGQRVARMLAAAHPERVRGVVMLAAGGKAPMKPGAQEALLAVFDTSLSPEMHIEAVRTAFFAPGNDPAVWRDGWRGDVAKMQTAATRATKLEDWWGGGAAPILVVQGLQDAVAVPENGRMLQEKFGPRVTLREIDGAGHAMLPEQPQKIADFILAWLADLPK